MGRLVELVVAGLGMPDLGTVDLAIVDLGLLNIAYLAILDLGRAGLGLNLDLAEGFRFGDGSMVRMLMKADGSV